MAAGDDAAAGDAGARAGEPHHAAALVRALEELRDEFNSVVAAGESTDPDFVFLDANARFGGLPLSVQVAATKVG